MDLGPLPQLFALALADPTYHPNITATPTNSSSGCSRYIILCTVSNLKKLTVIFDSGAQFDVDGAILKTLQGLTADLDVQSNVQLDDSEHVPSLRLFRRLTWRWEVTVPLHFTQTAVPAVVSHCGPSQRPVSSIDLTQPLDR